MDDWRKRANESLNVPVSSRGEWAQKKFYGDPRLAVRYLPVAYMILGAVENQLALGGISYGMRRVELPDGAVIRVIRNGEDNIVEIDVRPVYPPLITTGMAVYMESGFIDARSFGKGYQPKNRIYETESTDVTTDYKDTLVPGDTLTFEPAEGRSHVIPGGFGDKREIVWLPLFSTGLLRRAIQALAGRADPTYEVPVEFSENAGEQSFINTYTMSKAIQFACGVGITALPGGFLANMMALTQTFGRSRGLYRSKDYQYFFISIQTPNVYAYPCSVNKMSQYLISVLLENNFSEEEADKIESYILSGLSIVEGNRFFVGHITVVGASVYNGWHFNKDGSRADIIMIERVYSKTVEPPRERFLTSRHYRLSFSANSEFNNKNPIGDENPPLELELDLIEESNCTPRTVRDILWIPVYSLGKMGLYYWCEHQYGFLDDIGDYNAPVYCMYNAEDTLLVVRVSMEAREPPPRIDVRAFYDSVYFCGEGRIEDSYLNLTSLKLSGFFVDGGSDYRRLDKAGELVEAVAERRITGITVTLERPTGQPPFSPSIPYTQCEHPPLSALGSGPYTVTKTAAQLWGEEFNPSTWTETNEYLLLIPWFDAESFYCGSTVLTHTSGTRFFFYNLAIGEESVTWESGLTLKYTSPATSQAAGSQGGGLPVEQSFRWENTSKRSFLAGLDLYYRSNQLDSADYYKEGTDSLSWEELLGIWSALIDPVPFGPKAYPFFDKPFLVNQGLLDNVVYYADPQAETWVGGFKQRNIVDFTDQDLTDINFNGIFTGWT